MPRTSVQTEYNDNLFRDPSTDQAEADYITLVSAGFDGSVTGQSAGLTLSYDPAYSFYANNSEINRWRHNANGSFWAELTRHTRFDLDHQLRITEDPSRETDYTTRRGRFSYTDNATTARLDQQFGERDNVYARYVYRSNVNEDPTIEDRNTNAPEAGIIYWLDSSWGLEAVGVYTKGEYSGDSDDFDDYNGRLRFNHTFSQHFTGYVQYTHIERIYEGLTEDYRVYDPRVGIDWAIDDDSRIELGVGYFTQAKEFSEDDSGIVIDADIDKNWTTRRTRFNISGSSGYDQPDFGTENLGFSLFYEAGATLTYGFTRFISADVHVLHRTDEYIDSIPKRTDKNTRSGAGLDWQVYQWCRIGLSYAYSENDSTIETRDYTENRATFRIDLSPSLPYRF